ncbi:roadblock/LC7 domain-containing protein [Nocardia testacea]|uniref:roadblock/LC7 domain-containing protein n=1 Tax=Nocardia testacea TaxID=248551 RepID=UPI003A87F1BE
MSSGTGRRDVLLNDPAIVGRLLQQACDEIDGIQHAIMTSRDGLLIAANKESMGDTADALADRASAMAAAGAGIGDHFTQLVSHGRLQGSIFEAEHGCVGVFPISTTLLLIVTSRTSVSMGRFGVAAKRTLQLLQSPDP